VNPKPTLKRASESEDTTQGGETNPKKTAKKRKMRGSRRKGKGEIFGVLKSILQKGGGGRGAKLLRFAGRKAIPLHLSGRRRKKKKKKGATGGCKWRGARNCAAGL